MQTQFDTPFSKNRLAAILFSDIVGSVELKRRLGAAAYERILTRHNELFETGIVECSDSQIIKHTGDGYLACFLTASDAVRFALKFVSRISSEAWIPRPLQTRLCIHVGEVSMMDMAGRVDVIGLTADIAARIMSLAAPGQILLTNTAFNDARQYVRSLAESGDRSPPLRWMAHGPYLIKGADDPIDVFEVGIQGISPLSPPADTDKVKRVASHEVEPTLGWRPGVGLEVPSREGWLLQRKLGEGGFGEVWLAQNIRTKEKHVFKFCFDADRLRSFKRELTLFRLLRDALGDRKDIARLYDVKLDAAPFFVESEYTEGGNLLEWAETRGGISAVPLKERLVIVAQVAEATAAAHSVGILHKDIKPSNILIHVDADGNVQPRLADFGIGMLTDRSHLEQRAITEIGFTLITANDSSRTGTRLYSPPESLLGKPFTTQGDVYALGVLLYQMAIGDLSIPFSGGWEREIHNTTLLKDIRSFTDGDVKHRVSSASLVAELIRAQPERDAQLLKIIEDERSSIRRRRIIIRIQITAAASIVILVVAIVSAIWHIAQLKYEQRQTSAALHLTGQLIASIDPYGPITNKDLTIDSIQNVIIGANQLSDNYADSKALILQKAGKIFNNLDQFERARIVLARAADLQRSYAKTDPLPLAETLNYLCWSEINTRRFSQALDYARKCYDLRLQALGPTHFKTLEAMGDRLAAERGLNGSDVSINGVLYLAYAYRNNKVPSVADLAAFNQELNQFADHIELMMVAGKTDNAEKEVFEYVKPFTALSNGNRYKFPLQMSCAAAWLGKNGRSHAAIAVASVASQLAVQLLPEGHGDRSKTADSLARLRTAIHP